MLETVDVDEIWRALGKYKKYTLQQMIYIQFVCMYFFGFPMLVYVFVGYSPPHKCRQLNTDKYLYDLVQKENFSYEVTSFEKCETVFSVNISNTTSEVKLPCKDGYDYSIEKDTFVTEWNLVCDKAGLGELTQTMWNAGEAVGCFIFPLLADHFGRKPICYSLMLLSTTLSISASFVNYYVYVVMRTVIGALNQGVALAIFVYLIEQVPLECRGTLSALWAVSWASHVMVIAAIGYLMRNVSWRYVQMTSGLVSVHVIFAFWFMDESLRWLVANRKVDEARSLIKKVAKINKIKLDEVLPLLENESESNVELKKTKDTIAERQNKESLKDNICALVRNKGLLKTSAIMGFTWMTNALVYYGLTFTSVQMAGNRYLNFFITMAVDLPAVLTYMVLVKRLKRKQISVFFLLLAGVSLIISVALSSQKEKSNNFELASIIFSFIGKFGITGSYCLIGLFASELYPTNLRSIGIGIGSLASRIGGMIAPYSSFLVSYISWGTGIIFGACCVIAALLQLLLTETSGKELPQTVQELNKWNDQKLKQKIETKNGKTDNSNVIV